MGVYTRNATPVEPKVMGVFVWDSNSLTGANRGPNTCSSRQEVGISRAVAGGFLSITSTSDGVHTRNATPVESKVKGVLVWDSNTLTEHQTHAQTHRK